MIQIHLNFRSLGRITLRYDRKAFYYSIVKTFTWGNQDFIFHKACDMYKSSDLFSIKVRAYEVEYYKL